MGIFTLEESIGDTSPIFRTDIMSEKKPGFSLRRKPRRVESVDRQIFGYIDRKDSEPAVGVTVETVATGLDAGKLCSIRMEVGSADKELFSFCHEEYASDRTDNFSLADDAGRIFVDTDRLLIDKVARLYSSVVRDNQPLDASEVRAVILASGIPFKEEVAKLYDKHIAPIVSHDRYLDLCLSAASKALEPTNKGRNAVLARESALNALRVNTNSPDAHFLVAQAEFALGNRVRDKDFVLYHLWEAGRQDMKYIESARAIRLELLDTEEQRWETERKTALDLLQLREEPAAHQLVAETSFRLSPDTNKDLILYSLWRAGTLDICYIEQGRDIRNSLLGEEEALREERKTALSALETGTLGNDLAAEAHYLAARAEYNLEEKADRDFVLYHLWEAGRSDPNYIEQGRDVWVKLLGEDVALEERKTAYDALKLNEGSAEAHYLAAKAELAVTGLANAGLIRTHCARAKSLNKSYNDRVSEVETALAELEAGQTEAKTQ